MEEVEYHWTATWKCCYTLDQWNPSSVARTLNICMIPLLPDIWNNLGVIMVSKFQSAAKAVSKLEWKGTCHLTLGTLSVFFSTCLVHLGKMGGLYFRSMHAREKQNCLGQKSSLVKPKRWFWIKPWIYIENFLQRPHWIRKLLLHVWTGQEKQGKKQTKANQNRRQASGSRERSKTRFRAEVTNCEALKWRQRVQCPWGTEGTARGRGGQRMLPKL